MKREFEKEMRERRQIMENERDHSVAQDLERIQKKKKNVTKRDTLCVHNYHLCMDKILKVNFIH